MVTSRELQSPGTLGHQAIQALQHALSSLQASPRLLKEERNIRQPDSWLAERCWHMLASTGHADSALVLATLIAPRQPLAVPRALLVLAASSRERRNVLQFVRKRLEQHIFLLIQATPEEVDAYSEHLLLAGTTAAHLHSTALIFTCLERLDQIPGTWEAIMHSPDLRPHLAITVAASPLHPLTAHLITTCLSRFELAGAQFLAELAAHCVMEEGEIKPGCRPTMELCLTAVQDYVPADVTIRRYTATVLARTGECQAVLDTMDIMHNIMEAQRENALPVRDADDNLLRHVVRTGANTDVDFLVFTLQEALRALPVARHTDAAVRQMADRLVHLASRSDGWTAAGATAALIETGWLAEASAMVDKIPPEDTARSDAICVIVQGCLERKEPAQADAQVRKSWPWINQLQDENVKRQTIRRLAEAYVQAGYPQQGMALLARRSNPGFLQRLFRSTPKEPEEWHLNETWLELLCQLRAPQDKTAVSEKALMRRLVARAPVLLEGEALASFYLRILPNLLEAERWTYITDMLPGLQQALLQIKGMRHAVRTRECLRYLVQSLERIPHEHRLWLTQILQQWMVEFWTQTAQAGIWQTVYSIDGCLALVQALEGAQPILAIGRFAQSANENLDWGRPVEAAVQEAVKAI